MTEDEAIRLAMRLETAINALKEALVIAEEVELAPKESIRDALALSLGCHHVCEQVSPALRIVERAKQARSIVRAKLPPARP